MNNTFLKMMLAIFAVLSMTISTLTPVNAALGIGSWTANNDAVLSILNGQTAELTYGVTAVSTMNGKYSITLYDSNNQAMHNYFNNQATVNNGAVGWVTVNNVDYGNTAGSYYILITSSDSISSDSFRLNLNVQPVITPNPISVSCAVNQLSGTTPLDVLFTSTVTGGTGTYTYSWTFGDTTTSSTAQAVAHTYSAAGTYNSQLTATDAVGNSATASCGQIVARAPTATLTATCSATPRIGIVPLDVAFSSTVTGGSGVYTYTWTFGDTTTSSNAQTATHTYSAIGTYSTSLTVSDTLGNAVATNCGQIVVSNPASNTIPVSCSISPTGGFAPLDTTLSAQITGTGTYTYSWTFDDGLTGITPATTNTNAQVAHTYGIGVFNPTVTVTDASGNTGTANCAANTGVIVQTPTLTINSISCFPRIVDGHTQSCSVSLTSNNGQIPGGVDVDVFYANGVPFGSCTTNALSGACEVEQIVTGVGQYTVYATAQATGYNSDTDTYPRFTFDVFTERYNIINLGTYSDTAMTVAEDTFYRGQPLYIKFQVYDPVGNSFVTSDIVTAASLVSLPGGRADLSRMTYNGNWYYYELNQIPLSHDFLGGSNVFAFAFNFTGLTGGQAQVALTILNNDPVVNNIADIYVNVGATNILDLDSYGTDLEDNPLRYIVSSAVSTGYSSTISAVGNLLSVTGLVIGDYTMTVEGYDLDNAFDSTNINVHVVQGVITPTLTATCSATPLTGAMPLDVTFASTVTGGTGIYSYSWDFGDTTSSTTTVGTTTNQYTLAGTYNTQLTVTDAAGNTATASCGQIVTSVPTLNVACIALPTTGNAPLDVTFLVSATGGNGLYDYTYNYDGTNSLTTTMSNSVFTYTTAGTYNPDVSVIDTSGNTGTATCGLLVVSPTIPPTVTLIANDGGPYTGYTNEVLTVSAALSNSSLGIVSYKWNFGDGTILTTATQTATHTYTTIGNYVVTLTITDAGGYQDTDVTTALIIDRTNFTARTYEDLPDKGLSVMSLQLNGRSGEILSPNDDLTVSMNLKNNWNRKLENVRIVVSIPEYGLEARSSEFDLTKGGSKSESVVLPLEGLEPGVHYVRIMISNDDDGEQVKRSKYREIIVR